MNDIAKAMADAGVKLPNTRQRIWSWLKDHPVKTAKDVRVALNMPEGTTSAALSIMTSKGHLEVINEPVFPGGRPVAHYCVTSKEYGAPPRAPKASNMADVPPVKVVHKEPPAKGFDPEAFLENCTLRQLRVIQAWVTRLLGPT